MRRCRMGRLDRGQAVDERPSWRARAGDLGPAAAPPIRPRAALLLLAAVFGVVTGSGAHAQIPCGYEVTAVIQAPYCPPFGYPPTIPTAIGENGQVVGY